jgi:hypothetical protein
MIMKITKNKIEPSKIIIIIIIKITITIIDNKPKETKNENYCRVAI